MIHNLHGNAYKAAEQRLALSFLFYPLRMRQSVDNGHGQRKLRCLSKILLREPRNLLLALDPM